MKKRNKLLTLLLCAALIAVNLPVSSSAVYAAGEAADTPSKTAYADKKGLQENYDLVDNTDKPVQKVYFGYAGDSAKTPQVWKIAGKDEGIKKNGNVTDNIVLFADSAMKTPNGNDAGTIQFWSSTTEKDYSTDKTELAKLGIITYARENFTPTKVNANHYGTSTLRSELREMTDKKVEGGNTTYTPTKYFSAAQQKLMNETTITTEDTYGSNGNYTTTDILYAPYGIDIESCVTVGTNDKKSDGNLNDGLKIDRSSWPANTCFWLRAPHAGSGDRALVAVPPICVSYRSVDALNSVVPAFDLNLSNMLFASSAKGVTAAEAGVKNLSDTTNPDYDTMTFRWADKENKIKSTATWTASGVNVTKGSETAEVYLCVQGNNDGKDWIWSKQVSATEEITAQTVTEDVKKIDSLSNAAVDLSKCEIWLETTDTTDGLTYAATAKPKAQTPMLSEGNIKRTKNSLTIQTDGFDTATYGPIQYRCQQADANTNTRAVDWTEGTEISGLQAGTKYTVAIRYKGNDNYSPSDPSEVTISTLEDTGNTDTDSSTGTTTPDTDKTDGGPEVTKTGNTDGQAGSKSDPEGSNLVQTGDESSPALWIALMLIALAVAGGTVSYGRRKRAR